MKPIILLDVDGVLNPCPFKAEMSSDWKFEPTFTSKTGFKLNLSKEMGRAILDLNCNIIWLTTWILDEDFANPEVGVALGWDKKATAHIDESKTQFFWKTEKAREILSIPGSKIVWIDDDVNEFINMFKNRFDLDPHNRLLAICPDADVGLTKVHIDRIRTFLT
jgi:hypothetical protein